VELFKIYLTDFLAERQRLTMMLILAKSVQKSFYTVHCELQTSAVLKYAKKRTTVVYTEARSSMAVYQDCNVM